MCENCTYIIDDEEYHQEKNIDFDDEDTSLLIEETPEINYDCLCGDCQCDKKKTHIIDVGNIPEDEVHDYVLKIIKEFKKNNLE